MKSTIAFCVAAFVLVQLFHDSNGQDGNCQQEDFQCCARSCLMSRMCSNKTEQECGGSLSGANGTLRYPTQAGERYPHGKNCGWLITVNQLKVINITMRRFDLERSTDCVFDSLQFYDGPSPLSKVVGRFCGSGLQPEMNFATTFNQVYIWFRSDNSVNGLGFELTWNAIDPVCGGVLENAEYGEISSPGYPERYPSNRNCSWVVQVPPGNRIQFQFATLRMQNSNNCTFDSLTIYDGSSTNRYCSNGTPPPVVTSSHLAVLHFQSDSSIEDKGFHVTYATVQRSPTNQGCGGILTTPSGTFSSPNYPNNYDNNLNCEWLIRISPNNRMVISFSDFQIENHSTCNFDSLEIFDGANETAPSLGRFCGNVAPSNVTSSSHEVFIRFRTDSSVVNRGFSAQYRTKEDNQNQACGGVLTTPNGNFSSPNYPNNYDNNLNCEWLIRISPNNIMLVSFSDFLLESHSSCSFDSVEIFDGANGTAPSLGRYCGNVAPSNVTSSSHEVFIRFRTDSSVVSRGFTAQYSTRESNQRCGGILTAPTGNFSSPNYPADYENNLNCEWLISISPNSKIFVSFSDFVLEGHPSCIFDSLDIFDGANATAPSLGRYCGSLAPPDVTSSSHEIFIRFRTDSSVVNRGFAAQYRPKEASCGGVQTELSGNLSSPNFPDRYPANASCFDVVQLPMGYVINVTFISFDVEYQKDCSLDYLKVLDGSTDDSPEIGSFCGEDAPDIMSTYNEIALNFVSNELVQRNGFHAVYQGVYKGCGGVMTSDNDRFTSPGYPENYPHSSTCSWYLRAPSGSTVQLTFETFQLEQHSQCRYDYVLVQNSDGTTMGRYCGSTVPPVLTSSENKMFIKFVSDSSVNAKGFEATYTFVNATG